MSKAKSSTSTSPDDMPPLNGLSYQNIDYSKVRILQKNVVYVIGLTSLLANKNILSSWKFFGQYGKIVKIVVNKNGYNQNYQNETTYSAYVSYSSQEEASLALLAIDNCIVDGHVIRGSFGTTKYCTFFLKGVECVNKECLYLHEWANEEDTILKDVIGGTNKQLFHQQQKLAARIADIFNKEKKRKYLSKKFNNSATNSINGRDSFIGEGFPSIESIYNKENIYELGGTERRFSQNTNYNKTYNDYDFDCNDNDEEMEYVLVREPNKKKRKWKNGSQNNNPSHKNKFQNTPHKGKPKYNLEDFKRRLLPSNKITVSSPSKYCPNSGVSTSKCSAKTDSSSTCSCFIERINNLYKNPVKSRYDFAVEEEGKESRVDVPEFISDLIYMEMSSFTFYKQIGGFKDDLVMRGEIEKINKWNNTYQKILF